jgi:hypothetical protein
MNAVYLRIRKIRIKSDLDKIKTELASQGAALVRFISNLDQGLNLDDVRKTDRISCQTSSLPQPIKPVRAAVDQAQGVLRIPDDLAVPRGSRFTTSLMPIFTSLVKLVN